MQATRRGLLAIMPSYLLVSWLLLGGLLLIEPRCANSQLSQSGADPHLVSRRCCAAPRLASLLSGTPCVCMFYCATASRGNSILRFSITHVRALHEPIDARSGSPPGPSRSRLPVGPALRMHLRAALAVDPFLQDELQVHLQLHLRAHQALSRRVSALPQL